MWLAATLWSSVAAGDLSAQAPGLGSGLPACSRSTSSLIPAINTHKAKLPFHTPQLCTRWPLCLKCHSSPATSNSTENLVQISFLRDKRPPAPAALPRPATAQSIIASSVFFCVSCCHSHHPAVVNYSLWCQQTMGILNTGLYSTLHPSDGCPSHNTCTVNICWVHY